MERSKISSIVVYYFYLTGLHEFDSVEFHIQFMQIQVKKTAVKYWTDFAALVESL